jgi:DNA-binding XRE family transcriptional regulator
MNAVKAIRGLLGETQAELADAIEVSQGSVSFYESGATVLPEVAIRIVSHARARGIQLSLDQVYGLSALPEAKEARA